MLGVKVSEVEADRIAAIHQLMQKYHGQWVLKGAGSLILSQQLWICTEGNPGMGTGGMGDVLSGMIAALKAQFHDNIHLHEIISCMPKRVICWHKVVNVAYRPSICLRQFIRW